MEYTRNVTGFWCMNCCELVLTSDALGPVVVQCPVCYTRYRCEEPRPGGKITLESRAGEGQIFIR